MLYSLTLLGLEIGMGNMRRIREFFSSKTCLIWKSFFFFLSFLVWSRPPTYSWCRGLPLHVIILNDAHTTLPWTSDRPDEDTSTRQHITLTTKKHQCLRRDSNPQSQHASGRIATPLRPQGHWDRCLYTHLPVIIPKFRRQVILISVNNSLVHCHTDRTWKWVIPVVCVN